MKRYTAVIMTRLHVKLEEIKKKFISCSLEQTTESDHITQLSQ